jgi:hypothetical protein
MTAYLDPRLKHIDRREAILLRSLLEDIGEEANQNFDPSSARSALQTLYASGGFRHFFLATVDAYNEEVGDREGPDGASNLFRDAYTIALHAILALVRDEIKRVAE